MNPENLIREGLVIGLKVILPGATKAQLEFWAARITGILVSVTDPLQREIEVTAAFAAAVKAVKGAI